MTYLLFGATGWIGGELVRLLQKDGHVVNCAQARMEDRENVVQEIEKHQPKYILIAAGKVCRMPMGVVDDDGDD